MQVSFELFSGVIFLFCAMVVASAALSMDDTVEYKPREYGFEAKYVTINGIRICYVDEGSGERVLILVHGLSGSIYNWIGAIRHYSSSYRVVALDLPGHGNSEKRNDIPYGIPLFADTVNGLMDHLDIQKAVVMGMSMGGHTVVYFAWKYPERTEALVPIDAAGLGANFPRVAKYFLKNHPEWLAKKITNMARKGAKKNKQSLMDKFTLTSGKDGGRFPRFWDSSKPTTKKWIDDTNAYMKHFIWTDEFPKFNYAILKCALAIMETPMNNKVNDIRVPTLIVWGDHDGLVDIKCAYAYADGIAGSTLTIIRDCGHMPPVEEPEQFNTALEKFLATLPK